MTFLELEGVRKAFGATAVVKDFSLEVERGEFLTFLGPSGCGKTTILRMIAGFETPTAGAIRITGRDVTHLSASRRAIGMVFQAYALFPNMTVERNIGFGLKVAGKPAAAIAARVAEMLALIKLPYLAHRYPHQLSGGQQQRVSLARALAPNPQILLLDEPSPRSTLESEWCYAKKSARRSEGLASLRSSLLTTKRRRSPSSTA